MASYNVGDYYAGGTGRSGYYVWNGTNFQWKGQQKGSGKQVPDPNSSSSSGAAAQTFSTTSSITGVTGGANYRYPLAKTISSTTDYVSFQFYKYAPPFKTGAEDSGSLARYNASVTDGSGMLGESKESIIMYMPEDVQAEYGANWGGAGFGLIARQIMRGAAGNFDANALKDEALGSAKRALYDKIVGAANQALGTSVSTNQALGGIEGKIVNPNVEMMYEAPEMRGFSLSFKMFASSEKESEEIKKICNTFKKNMLPEFGEGAFISVPNIVKVTFMSGTGPNKFVSQFKPSAISNVSINYTPDGAWAAYKNGAPVATQLTIQFKELKMLFADDIVVDGETY